MKETELALRRITAYGDPLLRKQSARIEEIDDCIRRLSDDMLETMHEAGGIGLAAPQVGVSKMLFIADWSKLPDDNDPMKDAGFVVYINPAIHTASDRILMQEEGCLSLPEVTAEVPRPDSIEISYQNLDGIEEREELTDYHARVFQHEYDHLRGILFIDRIDKKERAKIKSKLQDILAGRIKAFDGTVSDVTK